METNQLETCDSWEAAVHEAGHAVVAAEMGKEIDKVELLDPKVPPSLREPMYLGCCIVINNFYDNEKRLYGLAGELAEHFYWHLEYHMEDYEKTEVDSLARFWLAMNQAGLVSLSPTDASCVGDLKDIDSLNDTIFTLKILQKNWNFVIEVAKALDDKGQLYGDEVYEIMDCN